MNVAVKEEQEVDKRKKRRHLNRKSCSHTWSHRHCRHTARGEATVGCSKGKGCNERVCHTHWMGETFRVFMWSTVFQRATSSKQMIIYTSPSALVLLQTSQSENKPVR